MARPPPFLRTRSSPTLTPTSSPPPLTDTLLSTLPLPLLVFEPSLRLHSINLAGRAAFGLPDSLGFDKSFGPGGAEQFFWTHPGMEGETPGERIRHELSRLASMPSEWGAGDAMEMKSASSIRWWSEVRVQSFVPEAEAATRSRRSSKADLAEELALSSLDSSGSSPPLPGGSSSGSNTPTRRYGNEWYSVLLLRPIPCPPSRPPPHSSLPPATSTIAPLRRQGSSSDRTPTLLATERMDPLGGLWPVEGPAEPMTGIKEDPSSTEGDWAHTIPPPSALSKEKLAAASAQREAAVNNRPFLPLRLSALPSPGTPPLSSGGTASSRSSRGSLLSNGTFSSASSAETSVHSASHPAAPSSAAVDSTPVAVTGMGISVSSAGIQLSQSQPLVTDVPQPKMVARQPSPPRPTSLPPAAPVPHTSRPDPPALLKFAALSNLPKTGVIVADTDLSSGFVNGLARELLMGIPARAQQPSSTSSTSPPPPEDWWSAGHWTADDSWSTLSGSTSADSSFFPLASSHSDRANPFEAKDLMHSAIIAAGEAKPVQKNKGTAGSSIRIGKPQESNRYRATVAAILARSLISAETSRGGDAQGRWEAATPVGASLSSSAPSAGPSFVGVGTKQGRKPYKVFDHSFSQRIIDPFEPLLEITARKGEHPASVGEDDIEDDSAASGMIVGVEVEVWEAGEGTEGSYVTSTSSSTRRKRVRRRLVEITAAPIFAPSAVAGEKPQHMGGMLLLRDVTDDRGRAAPGYAQSASLREGSKRRKKAAGDAYFKQILDHMPQMVWTTTPLGSHDFFNQNWYDFTGLEPEQSLGLGWQSPFHEDDMPAALKAWSHSLETGDPYSVEYRCRRGDGTWRWMLGRALPLRSLSGEIEAWFGTCTDVEEFIQIRSQLAKTQEQVTAIIEGADVLIWAIDRDWKLTFFSHPTFLGEGKEAVGRNIKDIWPESPLYAKCQEIMDGVVPSARMEWIPSRVMSENFYRCLLTPLTETRVDGTVDIIGVIVVATDVTDLNKAQERLRQSYEERAHLQASEAAANEASRLKTEFVANISHEIRTPIAGVINMAELLLDDTTLAEVHRTSIGKIMRSGEILLEMVGMVLDMGKVEAGKLDLEHRPFLLEDIIADARIFSVAASRKKLAFTCEADSSLFAGQVLGDMPRLRQVIANLLSNALKFTKDGTITLRVRQEGETRNEIHVRFEVEDTGVGIKQEAIPQLFKPFQQADASTARQYGGTGLGLCIAKNVRLCPPPPRSLQQLTLASLIQLLGLMGGTVELESTFGVGTKMTVLLPLEKAPLTLVDLPAPDLPQGDLVRENTWILVTDDNELNREIITKTLTKMRFNVESASDGLEAIAAVHRRHFDLVLMDGQMHTLDGYEATKRIRQSSDPKIANMTIIALTASAIQGDRERCIASGMSDYLSKPVRAKVLEAMILKHLATSPPASRRGSGSASTPGADTVSSLMSMDFSPVLSSSSAAAVDDDPHSSSSRRRPSHPSYSTEAVPIPMPPSSSSTTTTTTPTWSPTFSTSPRS
ncbi:hypothetical protein BCR35DRAFT_201665 [Leucosporidium creatinivorum]|uniref:Histidine kinase n=1 Tax=Leucosporidium creatinivorum TaxID=106004 RepID=A0A1Y2DIG8_9BASI|nr:hypothetical protein BCR35DRAFT_201665 [Leucosporidium creatinivorum]